MTIAVDWDVKNQTKKQKEKKYHLKTMNKVILGGDYFDGSFGLVKRGTRKILNYFY